MLKGYLTIIAALVVLFVTAVAYVAIQDKLALRFKKVVPLLKVLALMALFGGIGLMFYLLLAAVASVFHLWGMQSLLIWLF